MSDDQNHSSKAAENSSSPSAELQPTSELSIAPAFSPAPRLPERPVDRYVLEYWSVLTDSIAKSVATYYANATAAEVWPNDNFYRNAPPFVDSWLVDGWGRGRALGWPNVMPDPDVNQVYWTEVDALKKLIINLEQRSARARQEAEQTEEVIDATRAALALAGGQATSE